MKQPTPVLLASYNPDWPQIAASHIERLRVIGSSLVVVHHIGSTAVPGLAAKPIIDLMPLVTSLADLDRERWRVEALGYNWRGEYGMPGRRFCTLCGENGIRLVHLHFFDAYSPHAQRHIAFRDYLRAHPEVARAYEVEKRRVRDLHPNNSEAYCGEKAAWVQDVEAKALVWFARHGPARHLDFTLRCAWKGNRASQICPYVLGYASVSTISISDLSEPFASQWLKSGEKEDLILTSHGKPVAVLLPINGETLDNVLSALRSVRATLALTELQQSAEANGTSGLSETEIDAEIDAARRERHRK